MQTTSNRAQALQQLNDHAASCDGAPFTCPACHDAARIVQATALEDLSIVIISKDRPAMLARTIAHYERTLPGATIIVQDGTGITTAAYERLRLGAVAARTPFTVIASDDDVLLKPGLEAAMNALRADPKASAARGVFYGAYVDAGMKYTVETLPIPLTMENADARVAALFARFPQPFYSVYRTEVLCTALHLPPGLQAEHFQEMLLAARTVRAGKLLAVDAPQMLRNQQKQADDPDWFLGFQGHPTILWLTSPFHFRQQHDAFIQAMATDGRMSLDAAATLYGIYWARNIERGAIFKTWVRRGAMTDHDRRAIEELRAIGSQTPVPRVLLENVTAALCDAGWPRYE